jgi:hypothetical protein
MTCSICHVEMYRSDSNGQYYCRNFDCPPGNSEAHKKSWELTEYWRPRLLRQSASLFTVAEVALIIKPGYDKGSGLMLSRLAERIGLRHDDESGVK